MHDIEEDYNTDDPNPIPNYDLVFETDGEFMLFMDEMRCDFVVWAKETVYTKQIKLTLISHNAGLTGEFTLENNGVIIRG